MNKIDIHRIQDGVTYANAPAGAFCEIIDALDSALIGMIVVKPFCTNQSAVILNRPMASTDVTFGIKRVRPMQRGDSFTVTIGGG